MAYDYSKLKGRIIEKYDSQIAFSKELGLSERSLSLKLNNFRKFKQDEIKKIVELLDIPANEISSYFFVVKVQK